MLRSPDELKSPVLHLLISRILNDDTQIRLLRFVRDQFVRGCGILNAIAMGNQWFHIQLLIREQLHEGFHVTGFSPANMSDGIVDSLLLKSSVVTSRPA